MQNAEDGSIQPAEGPHGDSHKETPTQGLPRWGSHQRIHTQGLPHMGFPPARNDSYAKNTCHAFWS